MTKEEFLLSVNERRYPKFSLSDVHSEQPTKDLVAIVLTSKGEQKIAKFENGTWQAARFSSCGRWDDETYRQQISYSKIYDEVVYWIHKD